ncbi:hypothetical protein KKA77_00310, partial [Patescibacteria group bacterium]|nr:hypothetical protein [Patescibacteria group bacterium]MBU1783016.1 hypothetical protein [Patescibacteria group bacterium]
MNKIQQNKSKKKKGFLNLCLLFFLISLFFCYNIRSVFAEDSIENLSDSTLNDMLNTGEIKGVSLGDFGEIATKDYKGLKAIKESTATEKKADAAKARWDKAIKALQKSGTITLARTVASALNQIAFDLATYLGSGREGQKPLFITENWEEYYLNIADEAAGNFVES